MCQVTIIPTVGDDMDEQYAEYADCTGKGKVKEEPTSDDPNGGLKTVISLHA